MIRSDMVSPLPTLNAPANASQASPTSKSGGKSDPAEADSFGKLVAKDDAKSAEPKTENTPAADGVEQADPLEAATSAEVRTDAPTATATEKGQTPSAATGEAVEGAPFGPITAANDGAPDPKDGNDAAMTERRQSLRQGLNTDRPVAEGKSAANDSSQKSGTAFTTSPESGPKGINVEPAPLTATADTPKPLSVTASAQTGASDAAPISLQTSSTNGPQGVFQTAPTTAAAAAAAPTAAFEQIAAAIRTPSENSVSLRLDPPDLGRVTIDFSFENGRLVTAAIGTEFQDTSNLLRRHLDLLYRELESAGFKLNDLDVSVTYGGTGSGEEGDKYTAFSAQTLETEAKYELDRGPVAVISDQYIDIRL